MSTRSSVSFEPTTAQVRSIVDGPVEMDAAMDRGAAPTGSGTSRAGQVKVSPDPAK
ncbi:hypothetical protein PV646_43170 [Streptomyces sp. ID05-26A]|nr:hypothetical protein [Streptomyces sp. ID05-26A]